MRMGPCFPWLALSGLSLLACSGTELSPDPPCDGCAGQDSGLAADARLDVTPDADAPDDATSLDSSVQDSQGDATSLDSSVQDSQGDASILDVSFVDSQEDSQDADSDHDAAVIGPDGCLVFPPGTTDSCDGFALGKSCWYVNDPVYAELECTCELDGVGPIWICRLPGSSIVCPHQSLPEPCSDYSLVHVCYREGQLDVYCVCTASGWCCYA